MQIGITVKGWMKLMACLFFTALAVVQPSTAADAPAMVVGRVYHIEGDLLRYIPALKDWVAVVRDAPFGIEDILFSGSRGMAELIVPNGTSIRIGNSTQIQVITLDTDLTELDVASGIARFYNKSSDTVIKVASPFGYVLAYSGTVFDFYVGENSLEVVAVKGRVSFVHSVTGARYEVAAGSPSLLTDRQQVSAGEGTFDPDWNRWNTVRENFWAAKARVRGRSSEYLPPNLRDEAYALDENGRWERVYYEGKERWFWQPTTIGPRWSPFTMGRWTDWSGDQTWIPAEPFGYVTHHYGNWVYVGNYWYWAPPVVSVRVGLPFLDVGFYWYPGRVSWIHTGTYVGWVPLAPHETYYSHRSWGGPHALVVNNINSSRININVRKYAYLNHAVVVNQKNFYRENNYTKVRETDITPAAIINHYQAAPVVNNTVINNYTINRQRYRYTNVKEKEKPHNTVIDRIQQNQAIIQEGKKEKTSLVQERVKAIPEGRVNPEARIETPKVTNYIVPVREVNRPKSEIKLQQREIKSRGEGTAGPRPGVAAKPEQQPVTPGPPAARPERVEPPRPGEQVKPTQAVERETEKIRDRKPAEVHQELRPPEKKGEKSRERRPAERDLEKPKESRPAERDVEKRREPKHPEEEREKKKE